MLFFTKKGKIITKKHLFVTLFLLYSSLSLLASQHISIIGTGYVGLVTGACLAKMHTPKSFHITCLDIDQNKIQKLNAGIIPIFEPGLSELVTRNVQRNMLTFSHNIPIIVSQSDIIFIAVGTPTKQDGSVDVSYFYNALETIAHHANKNPTTVILKSTLPIGTGQKAITYLNEHGKKDITFHVISNPEFLREGTAIFDTMNPDRIIIGSDSEHTRSVMKRLYKPFIKQSIPFLYTSLSSAETIKYAANNFLAIKISYINEIANLCDKTGANIKDVSKGIGYDPRIGASFLKPGPGFGGSCLPKDTLGLLAKAKEHNVSLNTIAAAVKTNQHQKLMPYRKLKKCFTGEPLTNKTITVLGLAFKAGTDDIRYSSAIPIIEKLLQKQVSIKAYDPQAMSEMKKLFPNITYCNSAYEASEESNALLIITDWPEFKMLDMASIKNHMHGNCIVDARNIYDPCTLHSLGFHYMGIGVPSPS